MLSRGSGSRKARWTPIIQCAWCRSVKIGSHYVQLPHLSLLTGDWRLSILGFPLLRISVTHSACDPCVRRVNEGSWTQQTHPPRSRRPGEPSPLRRLAAHAERK